MADVVELEAGFESVGAFDAHAESKAGILFRVNAAGFENIGVDHAGAGDFVPAGFAEAAPPAVADSTGKIDFKRRLGELKMERSKPALGLWPVEMAGEIVDGSFEMLDIDTAINNQALKLMKHGGVSQVLLAAVAFGDIDHPDGRGHNPFHFPHLAVGGVGS